MNATSRIIVGLCLLCASTRALAQTSQSYLEGIKALEAKDHVKARPLLMKALQEGANKEETWYALGFVGQYHSTLRRTQRGSPRCVYLRREGSKDLVRILRGGVV